MALKISEEAAVQMPMKTVASLIMMVAIGTWAYFGIIETQNKLSTQVELMTKDLTENTEFRIKWPRGQLGSLPADSEQFMMIEDLYKTTEKINAHIEVHDDRRFVQDHGEDKCTHREYGFKQSQHRIFKKTNG